MLTQPTFLLEDMDRHNAGLKKAEAEEFQRNAWRNCWGWEGPKPGEYCEIDSCVVPKEQGCTVKGQVPSTPEQCRAAICQQSLQHLSPPVFSRLSVCPYTSQFALYVP